MSESSGFFETTITLGEAIGIALLVAGAIGGWMLRQWRRWYPFTIESPRIHMILESLKADLCVGQEIPENH